MLVRGDLGFPSPVFLVLVLVVPVILFVVRRKWRYAAARREEVKRLLVLASEESARAEFEAREGDYYTATSTPSCTVSPSVPLDSPLKPQHECAVCFSPTTTRCAKCKAVRYCSGKCQIVHWRQGHKDECRPYVAASPINDVGGSSYRQGDGRDYSDNFDMEGQQTAPPAERFQENLLHKSDVRVKSSLTSESTSAFSYKGYSGFSIPTKLSAGVTYENVEAVKQECQTTVSPARKSAGLGKINQNKSNFSDEDTLAGSSSSSSRTDNGCNESSLSEPSTTSSGFWDGAIRNKKSSIDELDDLAPSSFTEATNGHHTTKNGYITTRNGFNAASIIMDGSGLTGLRSKKSNDATNSSKEMFNDGLKSKRLPCTSKSSPSGTASHRASTTGEHSTLKDGKPFGGLPSFGRERANHVFNNKSASSHTTTCMEGGSSLSHLTSFTTRHASHSTKPSKVNEYNHRATTCSSQWMENSQSVRSGLKSSKGKVVDQLKPSKLPLSKGLFSYELFVKLYNWNKFELQPCGLRNCGNSCYANAVLQCLVYTPPLTAYLLEGLHSKACEERGWCFMCEFEGLVLKAQNGNSPLSPIRILTHIENIGGNLGHGKEEDAHEFLRYVIDALQSVCIKKAGASASNSLEEETTLIGLTFGGYLRSKIKCMKCGGKSETHERMMDLTVEIEGNIGTLEEALDKFTCTELLDGENKYKCSRCKSYEKAKKKLTLLEAPNVLTIALKRFQSGKFGKLNKSIHFPEILDMAPYVSGTSDKSPVYRLYGVVVHVDTMNDAFSGHYVCYVKNFQNRWFKIDDAVVKEVDLRSILTKGAYMLLYARCSPRAPRSIRSSLINHHHHDPRKPKTPASYPWDASNYHRHPPPPLHHHHHHHHWSLEDESSSSSDTSGFFSESCSCSTDTSRQDSSSIEDHVSGDWDSGSWRTTNLNSSDSDTSSASSFPSPLYSRLSDLYTSSKECRKLDCSCNSCSRVTNLDSLGGYGTNLTLKLGATFRKSTIRGRLD